MRYQILTSLFTFLFPLVVSGQVVASESIDSSNVYFMALRAYLKTIDNEGKTLFFLRDISTTDGLPAVLEGYELEFLDGPALVKRLKDTKEDVVYRIAPMQYDDGLFRVGILRFRAVPVTRKKGKLIDEVAVYVYFKYDCEKKALSVVDVR